MGQPRHCLTLSDVTLPHELHTTIGAILVPVPPALRMLLVAAFIDAKVRVYHFATLYAVTDWRV